ncbi:MAG TPA: TRAP transporter substrate-binding protein DctP [Burkholderiales bacterium]|nr:TRAP transporter substrate-binding protein DctP [Candidatus Methylomirabilis sp.]HSD60413.1 TRAP transporter substrate-binding protein DctP [Burkholderiales bacterium]
MSAHTADAGGLTRRGFFPAALALGLGGVLAGGGRASAADNAVRVRLGTLAPKGSSYAKHLQAMGEKWRQASGGGVLLTIYPDGTMGSEADMVRRMRLGQLQAGMLTAVGLAEIEPAVAGLQNLPMMFRSLEEVDYIGEKLQPMLEKRLEEKGFVVLFWGDSGWVRFFSKQPMLRPDDLRKAKLFVWTRSANDVDTYRSAGFNPVPLETVDILPSLQTGLIDAVPLPPSIALASQVDRAAPHMLDLAYAPLVGAAVIMTKTWEAIPAAGRDALRRAATEAGKLVKADGRRESVESVEAMRKRGLQVHAVTPDIEAEWRRAVEAAYPTVRGRIVPADIFDEVVKQLGAYRAARGGSGR